MQFGPVLGGFGTSSSQCAQLNHQHPLKTGLELQRNKSGTRAFLARVPARSAAAALLQQVPVTRRSLSNTSDPSLSQGCWAFQRPFWAQNKEVRNWVAPSRANGNHRISQDLWKTCVFPQGPHQGLGFGLPRFDVDALAKLQFGGLNLILVVRHVQTTFIALVI